MLPAFYVIPVLIVTVALTIRAGQRHDKRNTYIFKPLSTLLIIGMAALSFALPTRNLTYSVGVLIGLIFSLGGDVALMFVGRKPFAIGIVLFAVAQITYVVTFSILGRFSAWDGLAAILLITAGVGFYRLIRANLGSLRVPIIVYMVVISAMVLRAVGTHASPVFTCLQAILIGAGAVLFYLSDMVLAANKFWKPLRGERYGLIAYFGGQALLALAASLFV